MGLIILFDKIEYESADKIFLLENGKIISSGNHDYLINNSKEYKSLYQNQLK